MVQLTSVGHVEEMGKVSGGSSVERARGWSEEPSAFSNVKYRIDL